MVYTNNQIKEALTPVFREYGVRSAILFGSYARGQQTDKSDIDILVDSGLRGLAFFGLLNAVTETLKKDVDLLDVSQIKPNSPIEEQARSMGVSIYER